jgi:hypothetical protein
MRKSAETLLTAPPLANNLALHIKGMNLRERVTSGRGKAYRAAATAVASGIFDAKMLSNMITTNAIGL